MFSPKQDFSFFNNMDRLRTFQVLLLFLLTLLSLSHLLSHISLWIVQKNQGAPSTFCLDASSAKYSVSLLASYAFCKTLGNEQSSAKFFTICNKCALSSIAQWHFHLRTHKNTLHCPCFCHHSVYRHLVFSKKVIPLSMVLLSFWVLNRITSQSPFIHSDICFLQHSPLNYSSLYYALPSFKTTSNILGILLSWHSTLSTNFYLSFFVML